MTSELNEGAGPTGPVPSSFHRDKKCTHDLRVCVECGERFEGCSMQKKQVTCRKLCYERHFRQGANDKRPRKRAPVPKAEGMKFCPGCSQLLPLTAYFRHGDGRQFRCKDCQRLEYIQRRYNMTPEDSARYATTTSCEICGEPPSGRNTALDIDHDHDTGVVRGFLCNHCNRVLGHAHDDPAVLLAAAAYLKDRSGLTSQGCVAEQMGRN